MPCKPKDKEKKTDSESRLTNVRPWYVSLVDYGANHGGRDHHFALKAAAVAKRVPDADASDEDKRTALADRASSYGIEAREDAALSYPADAPTTEALYGDPVSLAYPLGGADNEPDPDRIRNALARFKQNSEEYKEETSRGRVYARIVRAALAQDIAVAYDPADPIDALLPGDLRDRLQADVAKVGGGKPDGAAGDWAIQSLIFDKEQFTREQVDAWLADHTDFKADNVDETGTSYRARQWDPQYADEFRNDPLTEGITAVYGRIKAEKSETTETTTNTDAGTGADLVQLRASLAGIAAQIAAPAPPMDAPAPPVSDGGTLDAIAALRATVKQAEDRAAALAKENAAMVARVHTLETRMTETIAKHARTHRTSQSLAAMVPSGDADGTQNRPGYPDRYTGGAR
jgi:hypothetical protein